MSSQERPALEEDERTPVPYLSLNFQLPSPSPLSMSGESVLAVHCSLAFLLLSNITES